MSSSTPSDEYDLRSVSLPYLSGSLLRLFVGLLESPLVGLVAPSLLKNGGVTAFRGRHFEDPPSSLPIHYSGRYSHQLDPAPMAELPAQVRAAEKDDFFPSVSDYARAYREGITTPEVVASRVLQAVEDSEALSPPLRAMIAIDAADILDQARVSTDRFQAGKPRSIFEGVPVGVKDEVDMRPHPTTAGTKFLGVAPALEDASVVARFRSAGALLIGKTNMHEIGIGVTGHNPHHGTPRNPYHPGHYTGGSSSGSAAAVAAGLCPVAIGADGGGSIRIPSSFCGLVGLKATFGRISEHGAVPLAWTLAHLGALTATTTDAALAYGVMAGPDQADPMTWHQPPPTLESWDNIDLSDLALGVYWPWFRHATPDMVSSCEVMLHEFERMGARIREVTLPDLDAVRVAHLVTIAGEMTQALGHYYASHRREYGLDVRINLALARQFTARDYILAQQVRTRAMASFNRVLESVDAIVTPTTGLPAPAISQSALPDGDSDLTTLFEIMRFIFPANLTGLPAISFPVGYNQSGLPVGMQAIGRAWQETTLLRLARAAEKRLDRQKPRVFFQILQEFEQIPGGDR